jgi:hypothetical protein
MLSAIALSIIHCNLRPAGSSRLRRLIGSDMAIVHARLLPQRPRDLPRIDANFLPPSLFVAGTMNRTVVDSAKRYREFVTNFAAERSALAKAQVVSIAGLPAADQARLPGDISEVVAVPNPARHRERQRALVDAFRPRPFP